MMLQSFANYLTSRSISPNEELRSKSNKSAASLIKIAKPPSFKVTVFKNRFTSRNLANQQRNDNSFSESLKRMMSSPKNQKIQINHEVKRVKIKTDQIKELAAKRINNQHHLYYNQSQTHPKKENKKSPQQPGIYNISSVKIIPKNRDVISRKLTTETSKLNCSYNTTQKSQRTYKIQEFNERFVSDKKESKDFDIDAMLFNQYVEKELTHNYDSNIFS